MMSLSEKLKTAVDLGKKKQLFFGKIWKHRCVVRYKITVVWQEIKINPYFMVNESHPLCRKN